MTENSAEKRNIDEVKSFSPKDWIKPPTPKVIAGVRHIIAVASGKGGVGKSTVAVNLAVALGQAGHKVGLVDADIHGPSVARMMGLSGEPKVENERMIPPEKYGIKAVSMGMILGENVPVIWRGPMVTKALKQLMLAANWGELDYLIVDLPPGTGDIHLSIAQNYKLSGVVMVTTPQDIALLDVRKAIEMFRKVGVPIVGAVENMSYFVDEDSGKKLELFSGNAAEKIRDEFGIKILGKVPVEPLLSQSSDNGVPFVAEYGQGDAAEVFSDMASLVESKI